MRYLVPAFFGLAVFLGLSVAAKAQEMEADTVSTSFVCTERGAMAVLQALTKSREDAQAAILSDECLIFPTKVTLRVAARTEGPVTDFEGDAAWVVEVGTKKPVEQRFTIAWPGFNASLADLMGQGA
jgi:hypothetical protein